MTTGKGKRPRDPNQLAKWIVDRSTAEPVEEIKEIIVPNKPSSPVDLSAYMAAIGRKGGQIGRKRRRKLRKHLPGRERAAAFGAGIFKSTDAGQTWHPTGANK